MDSALPAEINHPTRRGCILKLQVESHPGDAKITFLCDGCKMPGAGTRYTSDSIVLQKDCALAKPTLQHQLVKGTLELQHEVPAGDKRVRSACFDTVLGFHYYCSTKTSKGEYPKLHPCCASLPMYIIVQDLTFELRAEVDHWCSSCKKIDWFYRPWCYRSTCKENHMYFHIKCFR